MKDLIYLCDWEAVMNLIEKRTVFFCGEFIVTDKSIWIRQVVIQLPFLDTILSNVEKEEILGLKKFVEGYH